MLLFIVILLVLAAVFGVLGPVVKVAFVLVLAAMLAVATIALLGYSWFRHRMRELQRAADQSGSVSAGEPSSTIEVGDPVREELPED